MTYGPAEYGDLWAQTYDEEHDWNDPTAAVQFLSELSSDGPFLELGVGTGRIALPLAKTGKQVVGVDSSAAMVKKIRQKRGGMDIEVIINDMASSDLGGPCEIVFVAFNSIFGLDDQQRQVDWFRNVRRALSPEGGFVLECFVPDLRRFQEGNQAVRVLPPQPRSSASERFRTFS